MNRRIFFIVPLLFSLVLGACSATQGPEISMSEPTPAVESPMPGESAPPAENAATEETAPSTVQLCVITAADAKMHMESGEDFILLDVRTEDEFHRGHIPGAILIPVTDLSARVEAELPNRDIPIFVYCRSGRRSLEAVGILAELGYNVCDLGGILDWPFEIVSS